MLSSGSQECVPSALAPGLSVLSQRGAVGGSSSAGLGGGLDKVLGGFHQGPLAAFLLAATQESNSGRKQSVQLHPWGSQPDSPPTRLWSCAILTHWHLLSSVKWGHNRRL